MSKETWRELRQAGKPYDSLVKIVPFATGRCLPSNVLMDLEAITLGSLVDQLGKTHELRP